LILSINYTYERRNRILKEVYTTGRDSVTVFYDYDNELFADNNKQHSESNFIYTLRSKRSDFIDTLLRSDQYDTQKDKYQKHKIELDMAVIDLLKPRQARTNMEIPISNCDSVSKSIIYKVYNEMLFRTIPPSDIYIGFGRRQKCFYSIAEYDENNQTDSLRLYFREGKDSFLIEKIEYK